MEPRVIGLDFDGTVVRHDYPDIGLDVGAVPVLRELTAAGHRLVLNTMRSGETLEDAVRWFADHNITLYGVNKNPTQSSWTQSPKVYAHLYIDDAALGCPLVYPPDEKRPYADWKSIRKLLYTKGWLRNKPVDGA